jgi:hypothetical protein
MYISYWSSHSINRVFLSLLPHHRNDDGNGILEDEDLNVRSNQASFLSLYSRLIGESLSLVPLLCWVVFVVSYLRHGVGFLFFPDSCTFYVDSAGRISPFYKYSSRRLYTDVCTFSTGPHSQSITLLSLFSPLLSQKRRRHRQPRRRRHQRFAKQLSIPLSHFSVDW